MTTNTQALTEFMHSAPPEVRDAYEQLVTAHAELQAARDRDDEIDQLIAQSSFGTPESTALRADLDPALTRALSVGASYAQHALDAEEERDRLVDAARRLVAAAKIWTQVLQTDGVSPTARRLAVDALADAIDAFDPLLSEHTGPAPR